MFASYMRKGIATFIASVLLTAPILAGESAHGPAKAPAKNSKSAPPPITLTLEQKLEEQQGRVLTLEQLVKQQAEMLERFRQELANRSNPHILAPNSASTGAPAIQRVTVAQEVERLSGQVDALAEHSRQTTTRVTDLEKGSKDSLRKLEDRLKGLGNFVFSGDLRLRYEPFLGGSGEDRYRSRFRLRFNATSKFSQELQGGLRLSSGSDTDPISTNQTETAFFTRKPINIDRAYLKYTPLWAKPLTITGGKFAYTWKNTELTFDNDLNPEGLSQALSFDLEEGPLSNVTLVGYQLPFRESGSGPDSYMIGGQVQTKWNLGRHKFSAHAGYSDWFRTDAIRAAQTSGSLSGSSNRNAASATAFASRFGLLDLIAQLDIDTGDPRWPLKLLFDYVTNTRACAQADIAGVACNSRDRQGYWAEVSLGQTKKPHDVALGYTLIHIEREAVLGAFNFSDLRAPSNVVTHRFKFGYQAYKNLTLNYTLLVGRQLVTATSPVEEPWLKRMQFDAVYKF